MKRLPVPLLLLGLLSVLTLSPSRLYAQPDESQMIYSVDAEGHLIKVPLKTCLPHTEAADTLATQPEPAPAPAPPRTTGFAWGAELGTSIDMDGHDMSTINFGALCGWKSPAVPFAGIGAGVNMMMSNSSASFPIFAMVRTNFGLTHAPAFMEMRAGVVLNNVRDHIYTNLYLKPGIGMTLAKGAKFRSYLLLSYTYNALKYYSPDDPAYGRIDGLNYASATIGIVF